MMTSNEDNGNSIDVCSERRAQMKTPYFGWSQVAYRNSHQNGVGCTNYTPLKYAALKNIGRTLKNIYDFYCCFKSSEAKSAVEQGGYII